MKPSYQNVQERIPFNVYTKMPGINMSSLLELTVSAKHYRYWQEHPREDTDAYRLGRAVHTAVLEPLNFLRDYVLSPFDNFRTKSAQEWRTEQERAGKTVLTEEQFKLAEGMQDAVRSHALAMGHTVHGIPEATIQWTDKQTGLLLKGRLDYLNGSVVDLKTTRFSSAHHFARDAANLNYHVRLAFYHDGVLELTGHDLPVVIVAIEKFPPHDVACYRLSETMLETGRMRYRELLTQLQDCRIRNWWPGIAENEELPLELPAWAAAGTALPEAEPLTIGGEPITF